MGMTVPGSRATTRKGAWSFFPGEADPLCTPALLAIHRVYFYNWSSPLAMAARGGGGGVVEILDDQYFNSLNLLD
jgi:hypothetical protein